MSQHLIEKLKKSRETSIAAGGFTFTVRRPTDLEVVELRQVDIRQGDILSRFVVGWDGVTEMDIIPGGDGAPVPFESELFMAWVEDRPDLWAPLTNAALSAYDAHQKAAEAALKKPAAG
jgi:hypothetical protein